MVNKENKQLALSKSKYCGLWQCPKMAWMRKYKPEEFVQDDAAVIRMENGREVGELAKGIFGEFVDVTCYDGGLLDLTEMIHKTSKEIEKGTPVICEAAFSHEGLYCAVDILKKENDGWAIYEVKSSTNVEKTVYYADVAYQEYVLNSCGVNVVATYLVVVNNEYIFDGELRIEDFFRVENVTNEIEAERYKIEPNIRLASTILESDSEPEIDLSTGCDKPYKCGFWNYCAKDIPNPSVFDLYRMDFKKKLEYYYRGIVSYEDVLADNSIHNDIRIRQMEHYIYDKDDYVDREYIDEFLATLSYPLYFLDFETMQPVIPRYIGTKPYQQIPFQYSLHYIKSEGGELHHKEFLAEAGKDPRRELAERLCADIPMDVCVIAYYKPFECSRIKELAEAFPDLADHLLNIEANIVDLLVPFQSGWYYNKAMRGSFSIKSVLPALFPNNPELNYKALTDVHNGTEAMTLFPKLGNLPPKEQAEARKNLLAYCKLDTLAMVRVWEKLKGQVMDWDKYREDFLWFSYFGVTKDDVKDDLGKAIGRCADRAYLDLNRTIKYRHSASTIEENKELYHDYSEKKKDFKNRIVEELKERIQRLLYNHDTGFDKWHKECCDFILEEGNNSKYNAKVKSEDESLFKDGEGITYGQAQKWVNMTLKNLLVMGVVDFPKSIIESMHIPLDSYIYDAAAVERNEAIYESMDVEGLGLRPKSMEAWSKIKDYGAEDEKNSYMWYQSEVRRACGEKKNPIEWEGDAWIAQAKKKKQQEDTK